MLHYIRGLMSHAPLHQTSGRHCRRTAPPKKERTHISSSATVRWSAALSAMKGAQQTGGGMLKHGRQLTGKCPIENAANAGAASEEPMQARPARSQCRRGQRRAPQLLAGACGNVVRDHGGSVQQERGQRQQQATRECVKRKANVTIIATEGESRLN
jgi:hypothetical protein